MSSSQPERYSRNVLSNYLNAIVMVVLGFLVTPLLTHHLGIIRYGVWALIGSLIPYFELLELGFANATVTFVAKHLESGEEDLVHRTLNTSFFVLMIPGFGAAILAVLVAVFLPDIVHSIPANLLGQARILLLLLAFDIVVSIPMDTFGGALIAFQRYDLLNATLMIVAVLQVVAWFVVLELHGGLVALGVVTVAISLCGQVARFLLVRRLVPRLSVTLRAFDRTILRSFIGLSGWFSLFEISSAVLGGVDLLIVGIVVGVRAAAIYAVAQRLGNLPGQIMGPPAGVVFPYAGQLAGRGDRQGMRNITDDVSRLVMALGIPSILALIVLSSPAIRAWVGPSFHQSAEVAAILAASLLVPNLAGIPRAVVNGSGHPKVSSLVAAVEALVHVGVAVVLCHIYGVVGAAVATLAVGVVMEGVVLLPMLFRKLEMPLWVLLVGLVRAHVLPVVVAGFVGWSLARWPVDAFVDDHGRVADLAVVVVAGLAVVVSYYAVLYFTGTKETERERIVEWVRSHVPSGRAT